MASSLGNPALQLCTKLLMPGMIECIAKIASSDEKEISVEMHVQIVGEVLKAFSALFLSTADENSESYAKKSLNILLLRYYP